VTRKGWKAYWRERRIILRENAKVMEDMRLYGTGFIKYGSGDEPQRDGSDVAKHVPAKDVYL